MSDSFVTPWTAARQASLSLTISRSLLKFISVGLVMSSNHLILCHLLLLPSVFPSIRVFSDESSLLIRWLKDWSSSNIHDLIPQLSSHILSARQSQAAGGYCSVRPRIQTPSVRHFWPLATRLPSLIFLVFPLPLCRFGALLIGLPRRLSW